MGWITEKDSRYWMPDVLPQPTEEHQQTQSEKRYLTKEGQERMHPGWTYAETIAYVDDEYLFQNEGWKLVVGEKPVEPVSYPKYHYIKNPPEQWNEIDEKTIEPTYIMTGWIPAVFPEATEEYQQSQREKKYLTSLGEEKRHPQWEYSETGAYVDDEYLFQNEGWKLVIDEVPSVKLKHNQKNSPELWEEIDDKTVKVTYTFIDFSAEEIEKFKESEWQLLREKRDALLQQTDWVIVRSLEENLNISNQVITYRQVLRDFPETITDILEFDVFDNTLWPSKPEVYFEV